MSTKHVIHFWVKHFEEPSEEHGINGGKIFKLSLELNGERIANYERGWDLKPATEEAEIALRILLNAYN